MRVFCTLLLTIGLASPSLLATSSLLAADVKSTPLYQRIKQGLDSVSAIDTHDHLRPFGDCLELEQMADRRERSSREGFVDRQAPQRAKLILGIAGFAGQAQAFDPRRLGGGKPWLRPDQRPGMPARQLRLQPDVACRKAVGDTAVPHRLSCAPCPPPPSPPSAPPS